MSTRLNVRLSSHFLFALLKLGMAAGCNQLNFTVLHWNKSTVDFYLSQGCYYLTDKMGYHCMRCEGEALEHLAQPWHAPSTSVTRSSTYTVQGYRHTLSDRTDSCKKVKIIDCLLIQTLPPHFCRYQLPGLIENPDYNQFFGCSSLVKKICTQDLMLKAEVFV